MAKESTASSRNDGDSEPLYSSGGAGRDSGAPAGGVGGAAVVGGAPDADVAARALRKAYRHIIPLGMAIIFISNIDRSNLAFAALTFNYDNGFGPSVYSTAVSLFFAAYCVLQVPSNLAMLRVGHRPWLTLLVVGWGTVAACFALVTKVWSLYLLRLLLGVLEAGALPALWHVFAVFFPARRLTLPYAALSVCPLLASMVASPLATGLLAMDGLGGLKGWQWLFLLEGAPAVLVGAATWLFLPDSIRSARFLDPRERSVLAGAVEGDRAATRGGGGGPGESWALVRRAAGNGYVWLAFLAALMSSIAAQVFLTFTPIIISNILNGTALSNAASVAAAAGAKSLRAVGLSALPFGLASITAVAVSAISQRLNEQFFHVAATISASGLLVALAPLALAASPVAGFAMLCAAVALGSASNPPMMVLASRLCLGDEQAVVLPLVNSAVVLGGIVGPLVTGAILNKLGGFTYVFVIMGCLDVAQALLVLLLRAWVLREGGLPDGGCNGANARVRARRAAEEAEAAAVAGPKAAWGGGGGGEAAV